MTDPTTLPAPKHTRSFRLSEFLRPRFLIALLLWMLLLHGIALALIAWHAAASHEMMLAQVAADAAQGDNSVSPGWRYRIWAGLARGVLLSYLFGFAPIVTLLLGVALIVLGATVRGGSDGWLWTMGGVLAGGITGLSNLFLSLRIAALLEEMVSPSWSNTLSNFLRHWQTLSSLGLIAIGTILGIVAASILRRIAFGGRSGVWRPAGGSESVSMHGQLQGISSQAVFVATPNASRLAVAFLIWTALVQTIPVSLCLSHGVSTAGRLGSDTAFQNPFGLALFDARLFYGVCATPSLVVTAVVGVGLVLVAFDARLRETGWPWLIGGAIAGAVMGRAWLCLSFTLFGVAGESNLWGRILALPAYVLLFIPG
ncbi:MAG TPA: hypothetical protein VH835_14310, partial [Dongiaceae bacterium]